MKQEQRGEAPEQRDDIVVGRNAVLELLASGRDVECVYLQKGLTGTAGKIAALAKDRGVVIKDVSAEKLDGMCRDTAHQGVAAVLSGAPYSELEDIFARAGDEPVFLVVADGLEDPHNLGAVIRTAEAAGAHGLIIPRRRSAGLTQTVSKTSAGAVFHLPVVRVANLVSTVELLKKRGVWFYAADADGQSWESVDYSGPVGLVIGSEGKGISRLLREKCDFSVALPMRGKVNSLNASVAAGIILYEIARQRMKP